MRLLSSLSRPVVLAIIAMASLSIVMSQSAIPAYGHAIPSTFSIQPNAILEKGSVPSQLVVSFSERPDPKTSYIHVLNSKNERVDNSDFTITGENGREAAVTLNKAKLADDGVYSVSWRTMSLDDGHIAEGGYVFGVGNVTPDNIGNSQTQPQAVTFVTSTSDALLRWPVIVSQAAIVGGVIAHLALQGSMLNRSGNNSYSLESTGRALSAKRFILILIAAAVAIAACGSGLIFLQASNLASTDATGSNNDQYLVFIAQSLIYNSPAGTVWLMRIATSSAIIALSIGYYTLKKKSGSQSRKFPPLLLAVLAAGAISIFSNSMLSHNSAATFLPSVAVFADWLHFMAVSAWVGGLFYFSAVLLLAIRSERESGKSAYYLSLILPRFSLLAIASLGIIGVTGIYMAWIQLHTLDSLFYTQYGNNLIIKLSAALPMVLLGVYHQVKLHKGMVMMAAIGRRGGASGTATEHHGGNAVSRFSKTIKIESLIGIGVLFAASLLTITSPPSHMHGQQLGAMTGMEGMGGNGNYLQKATISGVDTVFEIAPFHAGFNTFTVTLSDAGGAPPQNINAVFLRFTDQGAGIGPIVATLGKTNDGIYSVTGGYLSQTGNWKVDLVVQRISAYDLNHSYDITVDATGSGMNMDDMAGHDSNVNGNEEAEITPPPSFDSFAWLAIGLSIAVAAGSAYYYRRSKQQLKHTLEFLKGNDQA